MSATKFTPGPWSLVLGENAYGHPEGPLLGTIKGSGAHPSGGEHIAVCVSDLSEAEANASLIAAAPELYEALEKAVANTESLIQSGRGPVPLLWEQLERAKIALAKARGEQVPA